MAFQSSTSIASNQLLINAIAVFAQANGWVIDRNNLIGQLRTVTMHKPGVTDYIHLFNNTTSDIRMRASVNYDSAFPPGNQTAVTPADCVTNNLLGPYPNVWLFADGDEINIVVRRSDTTGAYSHMAFGAMTKYGAFTGGTFIDGTFFNTTGFNSGTWDGSSDHGLFGYGGTNYGYVRVDADGIPNKWYSLFGASSGGNDFTAYTNVGPLSAANIYSANQLYPTYDIGRLANSADDNVFSGRSILQVIELSVRRLGTPIYVSLAGYFANTRYVSLAKFEPEQEISIADETWMVFPVVRKAAESTTQGAPNASVNNGFAIRKVA